MPHLAPSQNPFRSERIDQLDFLPGEAGWDGLEQRWRAVGGRAAIVGPHGSGKTTLVDTMIRRGLLPWQGCDAHELKMDRVKVEPGRLPKAEQLDIERRIVDFRGTLIIDGVDLLPRRLQRRVWRRCFPTLVTSHRPTRLAELVRTQPSVELLIKLTRELLGDHPPPGNFDEAFDRHRGNIREIFRGWYDEMSAQ